MKVLKLTLASLFLTSCLSTPGMEEPAIRAWVIKSDSKAECIPREECSTPERNVSTMIGFQCVSPRNAGKINNHHETLHHELNKRIGEDK
jgi:hypothetical protein